MIDGLFVQWTQSTGYVVHAVVDERTGRCACGWSAGKDVNHRMTYFDDADLECPEKVRLYVRKKQHFSSAEWCNGCLEKAWSEESTRDETEATAQSQDG